jgi:hypothetical protein
LNPHFVALTYAVVASSVIPLVFTLFKTPYELWEVILAACVGAALSFIATVGGVVSLAGTLGVLFSLGQGRNRRFGSTAAD